MIYNDVSRTVCEGSYGLSGIGMVLRLTDYWNCGIDWWRIEAHSETTDIIVEWLMTKRGG